MTVQYNFENYHKPEHIDQAVSLMSVPDETIKVIAGGTDILPRRQGGVKFKRIGHLIDISGLKLNYVHAAEDSIHIGSGTDINTIAASPFLAADPYNALSEAACEHSTLTIRNRATIGGNLCNASPCADLALPLLVLSASAVITGAKGTRTLLLESFFKGPNCTALESDEILIEIQIPNQPEGSGASFFKLKHHQTEIDMAIVNVATQVVFRDNHCFSGAIAIGGAGPTAILATKAANLISGQKVDEKLIRQAARVAADESAPITDIRATASYRKEMVAVLVENSLIKSVQRSRQ